MTISLYVIFILVSLVLTIVHFATGAFFSKTVGPPLGLGVVVTAALGIFFAATSGSILFAIAGIILLVVGALLTLAALGGE